MNTIGEVSREFHLPVSTLRYYDNEGLFPHLEKKSGVRQFSPEDKESLRVVECLKKAGLEIKDIKRFMDWCKEGPSTYAKRKELFEKQKEKVEQEIASLAKTLAMIEFKCWYYEEAIKDGNENRIKKMIPNHLPNEIRAIYDESHQD